MTFGADEKKLLGSLKQAIEPSLADAARVRTLVEAKAALGAAAVVGQGASSSLGGWLTASLGALVVGGAIATTLGALAEPETPPPVPAAAASAAPAAAAEARVDLPPTAPEVLSLDALPNEPLDRDAEGTMAPARPEQGAAMRDREGVRGTPPPSGSTASLAREVELLRAADAALRRGDFVGARAELDRHAGEFPRGTLASEREGTRVLLDCKTSAGPASRARAEQFLEGRGTGPLDRRIRQECALD